MKNLSRRAFVLMSHAVAAGILFTSMSTSADARTFLRFAGGIGGSSWEITAGKLSDMFSRSSPDIQAIAQPGNMGENLSRMARGEADLGLTYGITFRDVISGTGPFGEHHNPNLRLLAALYPAYQQPLVSRDAPWETLEDLAADPGAARIAALTPGSATYILANAMMEAAGADFSEIQAAGGLILPLNYSQGLDGMRSGNVNLIAINGPEAHPTIVEYENQGKLLIFTDEVIEQITKLVPGTAPAEMPAAYSFLDEPYKTFAVYTTVVINADVPEDVVYTITKALWDNLQEFHDVASYAKATDIGHALVGSDVLDVHPGALRYYREVGLVE
jgi:uncharacterized protein